MDYIREEFLRQNRILTRLMVGEETQTEQNAEEKEASLFLKVKDSGTGTRKSRATAEEVLTAGSVLAGADGGGMIRPFRQKEASSGETNVNLFYAMPRNPPETRGTADIRAVSRSIQRDARRYDGGFSIY